MKRPLFLTIGAPPARSIVAIAMSLFAGMGNAQDNFLWGGESLGLVHKASIKVFDNVTGGCWTNAEAIKQKARLTLEQSGINVYLEDLTEGYPFAASIYIDAFGERSNLGTCFGSIEVGITDTASRTIGDTHLVGSISYFRDGSVAIGSRSLNEPFEKAVDNSITKLAADVLSGRRADGVRRIINIYESALMDEPETLEEWEDRVVNERPES